jgi:tRNA (guanine10-N2)-dimethyltransferase
MTLCYARLSGAHPTLPIAELEAISEAEGAYFTVLSSYGPLALLGCSDRLEPERVARRILDRAGYTRRVGVVLGVYTDEQELLDDAGRIASLVAGEAPIRVETHRIGGLWRHVSPESLARRLASRLEDSGVRASPRGTSVLEVILVEGVALAGLRIAEASLSGFHQRSPGRRPFFKPGPLDPFLSRAMVNLSRLRRGGVFWEPFCGTGGMALEACLVGASRVLCGDLDKVMAAGSRVNLDYYNCGAPSLSMIADAAAPPVARGSVDAVATDPPYGRSTKLGGRQRRELYRGFLGEAAERLVRGAYLVYAAPAGDEAWLLAAEAGLLVVERHYMYVHGSLTREIVVARRV